MVLLITAERKKVESRGKLTPNPEHPLPAVRVKEMAGAPSSEARHGAAAALLGAAVLAACAGWSVSARSGGAAELFSWDSYSTHAIRMKHRMVYAHGVAQPGPLILERKLHYPEAESKDYPYPTNDGTPQWPSNAPIHDTRSGADDPVWDGTQLYRNWGVPRDGVVVSKDCNFLPRKDCLPSTMKNWRHGQPLPGKDRQFMIEADSMWKGPDGHKLSPGEKEAKEFFEGQSKANKKRLAGALETQVQAVAKRMAAAPLVAVSAGATYGGYPFYAPAAAPYGAPLAPVAVDTGGYAAPEVAARRQGWNYGQTPLSAPGLGRAALVPMVGHTIPDSIMAAFERDNKGWKPVKKKVTCTTCAIAVASAPAVPMVGQVAVAQRAVATARAAQYTPRAAVPTLPASVAPVAAAAAVATSGFSNAALPAGLAGGMWEGYDTPLGAGALVPGLESPLPIGPGGVAVPGAGTSAVVGLAMGSAGAEVSPATPFKPFNQSPVPAAAGAGVYGGAAPVVHVDKWTVGKPHARRSPAPKGTTHVAAGGASWRELMLARVLRCCWR